MALCWRTRCATPAATAAPISGSEGAAGGDMRRSGDGREGGGRKGGGRECSA